ncbi:MAG: phosphoribosylglycinamide formyltransferase [Myxococcales bacterium]|nr:phosphoribosylglycinamide formyltransferase [Myxococcales bacterium]
MVFPIAVLASGTGSNLAAIFDAIDRGECRAEVTAVISDRSKAGALQLARQRGVKSAVVPLKAHPDRQAWDRALAECVAGFEPALVVLAGFMKIVGPAMVERFSHRIINVHPALLPLFPGTQGPADAIAAGVCISGCTVHLVDAGVDTGPILAQAAVPVVTGDDAESLHRRIQVAEHRILPAVIDAIACGHMELGPSPRHRGPLNQDDSILFSPPLACDPNRS